MLFNYIFIIYKKNMDALQKVGRTLGGAANEERIPEEENQVIIKKLLKKIIKNYLKKIIKNYKKKVIKN